MRKEKPKREQSLTQRFWAEVALVAIAAAFVIASFLRAQQADDAQRADQVATEVAIAKSTAFADVAGEHAAQGLILLDNGDWSNAITQFTQAINVEPSASLYANRARAYTNLADYDHAIADYTEALERAQLSIYRLERADVYVQVGRYTEAIAAYTEVLRAEPENFDVYYKRAEAYRYDGQYQNAYDDYNIVIEMADEPNPDAYFYRGYSAYELGDNEQTIADYQDYLGFYPEDSAAHYNLGLGYRNLDDFDAALENFTQSVNLAPNDPDSYFQRAQVYYTLDAWAEAIADYDVVLDLKPDYYDAMVYRGSAYHYLENYDAALADFERAITMDAAHAHAFVQRGQTYQTLGDLALAQADWETAINMGIEKTETTAIASLPDSRNAEIAENGLQLNYTFTGTAGMVITVKLTAARDSGFDGMMLLRGPDDKPLTLSDDAYDKGYDPLIEAFELPETGDYTLVVVGFDGTSTGTFNLKLTTGTPSK